MSGARDVRHDRPATRRNDDTISPILAVTHRHRMCVDEASRARYVIDTASVEIFLVDTIEPFDVSITMRLERGPVVPVHVDIESVVGGALKLMQRLGGVPHDLFRHTADVDTGTTQGAVLDRCGTSAILGRTLRVGKPAAAPADHEQVIVICQNLNSLSISTLGPHGGVTGSLSCARARSYHRANILRLKRTSCPSMPNPLLDTSSLPRFADIAPEHVVPALEQLIATQRSKLEKLLESTTEPDFDSLVAPLEDMEHELSRVWSPVSHLQGVLGSHEWRDAYNAALPILTEYGTEISQNARLQQAYARVDSGLPDDASEARKSAVAHALRDFRLAGVDLPDEDKTRFREIMQALAAAQADFDHNIQDASDAWTLHFDDVEDLGGLPPQTLERAAAEAARCERDGWLLTLDFPTYHAVMTHAESRGLRETLYHAWVTRASDQSANVQWDNSDNIDKILALRHEAAKLVGFDNYAGYSLATKMAETPDQVIGFLRELASHSRAAAEAELNELRELASMAIEPWDLGFCLEKLKQQKFSFSNEELRQYFPVATVIDGLFDLASNLYGVTFKRDDSVITWHNDARYYAVQIGGGEEIGSFYTDLFARSGKRTGAWVDDCINRKKSERCDDVAGRISRLQFFATGRIRQFSPDSR